MSHGQTCRRVLDLLAGWADHVEGCAESVEDHPGVTREQYRQEADAILDLYSRVLTLEGADRDRDLQALATLEIEIKTLLLRGPQSPGQVADEESEKR